MLGKSRNAVFSMICGWAGSKSNLGKAAGAEVAVGLGNEKFHAAVARSTFSIKIARRCSEKHIFKSKCQNTAFSDHFLKL